MDKQPTTNETARARNEKTKIPPKQLMIPVGISIPKERLDLINTYVGYNRMHGVEPSSLSAFLRSAIDYVFFNITWPQDFQEMVELYGLDVNFEELVDPNTDFNEFLNPRSHE